MLENFERLAAAGATPQRLGTLSRSPPVGLLLRPSSLRHRDRHLCVSVTSAFGGSAANVSGAGRQSSPFTKARSPMSYDLSGTFIEACDCTVICPCWVDDDPVGGHCTGLIAWHIKTGKVNGISVDDRQVVSVSTHSGNRRASSNTTSVVYVDSAASDDQFRELSRAFTGQLEGPLKDLAQVSGVVVGFERATISVRDTPASDGQWEVLLHKGHPDVPVISATGTPKEFDGGPEPLTLQHTALDKELGISEHTVTAQEGHTLSVNVGALPAGTLTVGSRSGMRGSFSYKQPPGQGTQ